MIAIAIALGNLAIILKNDLIYMIIYHCQLCLLWVDDILRNVGVSALISGSEPSGPLRRLLLLQTRLSSALR